MPDLAADVARVCDLVAGLRADFAQRDALYQEIDRTVFGEVSPKIPEAYKQTARVVHSPLASHMTNTITAALSINPPRVEFEPTGFGDSHQTNATLREHFFEASWKRQEQEARRQLLRLFVHSLVTKGEAIIKTIERSKRAWAGYDAYQKKLRGELDADESLDGDSRDRVYKAKAEAYKRGQPYPIASTDVLPETFYYLQSEDGFSTCVEVKDVPYYETLLRYGAGLDRRGNVVREEAAGLPRAEWQRGLPSGHRTLTLTEVWDWDQVSYVLSGPGQFKGGKLAGGVAVKQFRHKYGDRYTKTLRGPYFQALGITTSSRLPERAGLSVLYGFLDLFPLLDSLLTIQANGAFLTGFPTFKRLGPAGMGVVPNGAYGSDGTEAETQTLEPGTIYPYDIGPVEQPKAGQALAETIGLVRGLLELALPSVVQGVISGDESGYALNQAAHLARLAWDPIVQNAEHALGMRTGFESWLIEHRVREAVHVLGEPAGKKRAGAAAWLSVGPDELQGVHRYRVHLDPETPSNKVIETRAIGEQIKLEVITYEEAVEQSGGNPDEVERSWQFKKLKASPAIQGKLEEMVLQKLGTIQQRKVLGRAGESLPPPVQGMGLNGDAVGNVFAPGMGMPIMPTPAGAVTGVGPAMQGGQPGLPAGMAGPVPGPPANSMPLPGQS